MIRERLRAVEQESKQNVHKNCSKKSPQTFDTSNSQRMTGTLETTTIGRMAYEGVELSTCDRVESVSVECSPGMDDVLVMRSPLESQDGSGRRPGEEGLGCDTAPLGASISKLWKSEATPTNITQEGDVLRLQSISPVQKSGTRTTCYGISCFTVCVLVFSDANSRDPGNGSGCRISQLGGQLQHVGSPIRDAPRSRLLVGATPVSFVFCNHWKALRAILQLYPDHQKAIVAHQIKKVQRSMVQKWVFGSAAESLPVEPHSVRQ